jgi:hypothetical protein
MDRLFGLAADPADRRRGERKLGATLHYSGDQANARRLLEGAINRHVAPMAHAPRRASQGCGPVPRPVCFSGTASTSCRRRWTPSGSPDRSTVTPRVRISPSSSSTKVTSPESHVLIPAASKARRRIGAPVSTSPSACPASGSRSSLSHRPPSSTTTSPGAARRACRAQAGTVGVRGVVAGPRSGAADRLPDRAAAPGPLPC